MFWPCTHKWLGYQIASVIVQKKLLSRMMKQFCYLFTLLLFRLPLHASASTSQEGQALRLKGAAHESSCPYVTGHCKKGNGKTALGERYLDLMTHPSLTDNPDSSSLHLILSSFNITGENLTHPRWWHSCYAPTYPFGAKRGHLEAGQNTSCKSDLNYLSFFWRAAPVTMKEVTTLGNNGRIRLMPLASIHRQFVKVDLNTMKVLLKMPMRV